MFTDVTQNNVVVGSKKTQHSLWGWVHDSKECNYEQHGEIMVCLGYLKIQVTYVIKKKTINKNNFTKFLRPLKLIFDFNYGKFQHFFVLL